MRSLRALTVGCSIVETGSVEIGSCLRNSLMKLRESELGDANVVLTGFAYYIGHFDFIGDTIEPSGLQFDECVYVALLRWRWDAVEQEISLDGRAVRRSEVHRESPGKIPTQVPFPNAHVLVSGVQKLGLHSEAQK